MEYGSAVEYERERVIDVRISSNVRKLGSQSSEDSDLEARLRSGENVVMCQM